MSSRRYPHTTKIRSDPSCFAGKKMSGSGPIALPDPRFGLTTSSNVRRKDPLENTKDGASSTPRNCPGEVALLRFRSSASGRRVKIAEDLRRQELSSYSMGRMEKSDGSVCCSERSTRSCPYKQGGSYRSCHFKHAETFRERRSHAPGTDSGSRHARYGERDSIRRCRSSGKRIQGDDDRSHQHSSQRSAAFNRFLSKCVW